MKKIFLIFTFFALLFFFVDKSNIFSSSESSEFATEFQAAFGSKKEDSRYDAQYDTNADGRISAVDYLPLRLKSLQKGAVSSQSETSQKISFAKSSKGYIIEFKDAPLAGRAQIPDYKAAVLSRHEEAKGDILKRLGKKRFITPSSLVQAESNEDTVNLLGEYTAALNGVALDINKKQAEALKTSSYIKRIRRNGGVKAFLNESVPLIKAPDVWNMKDGQGRPVTGQDVKIAIIDTGIDYTHQDLGGCTSEQFVNKQCAKVISGYDFVNADNDPIDDNGHGTHVSSIAAGNGVLKGVSPDASLIGYKVLDQWGGGWEDDVLAAIEAVIQTRLNTETSDDIDVMNLSLGGWGNPDDPLSSAIDRAADMGIVSAISAGNSGPDEQTIGSPGLASKAITVGATDKTPKMAGFSSKGPVIQMLDIQNEIIKPNLVAPGVNICAARANSTSSASASVTGGGTTPDCDKKHIFFSGTSMAAPHVAGAAALLKQLYPQWTPAEIKGALMAAASDLGETPFVQGSGMINVAKSAQASSLITPGSLSFGFVDKSARNTTITKELTIKNIKKTVSYSLFLNTSMPVGAKINFSENNFSLNPSESKTIQVRLNIDNDILNEGFYASQITIAEDGVESYRVPVAFFKKAILLTLDRQVTNNAVFARITTPYVGLSSAPLLEITAPSGQKSTIPLVRSLFDPTKWDSGRIDLSENGTYSFNTTSSQMSGYSASASVVTDKIAPQFSIKAARNNQALTIQITPNQNIRDPFYKTFSDENDGTGNNLHPSLLADNTNIYAVYQQLGEINKIYFVKSADGGGTWDKPVVLAQFPDERFVLSSIAKLNGKLFVMLFDGKLKITSSNDGLTWSTPTTVAENVNILDYRIFAFKGGGGKLHLVYGGSRGEDKLSPVYYQNSGDGERWSAPYKLGDTPMWTDLDMDVTNQEIRIVYLKSQFSNIEGDKAIVYLATSKDGNTWNTRNVWENTTASILYPSITSSSDKTYIVLNNGATILFIRASNQNNETVIQGGIATGVLPRIGVALNKLYLAWTNFGGSPPFFLSLHIRRSENEGDSWGADLQSDTTSFFVGEMATAGNVLFLNWPSQEPSTGLLRIAFTASTNMLVEVLYNLKTEFVEATKGATDLWSASATWQGYGAYAVNVKGIDLAGNLGSSSATFDFPQPATIPLSVRIQGIGSLEWWHNRNPLNKERVATVAVFDENKVQKKTVQATLTFDGNAFSGTADLSDLPQGSYYLTVKFNNSLSKLINSVPIAIAQGSKITVQGGGPPTLTMGDVNNNDVVDINDYYKLISCFGATTSSARWNNDCEFADFYDDGRISVVDYSVLVTYYGKKGDAISGLPGALVKPQTTNTNKVVYVDTKIGCSNPKGLSPDQICQKQGYTRSVEAAGTAANGYWWKQCGGASVSNCQGLNCSVNKLDCTNTPGYWSTQQPYPSRYKKAGKSNTVYKPTELGFSCGGYSPGWTMRVACQSK